MSRARLVAVFWVAGILAVSAQPLSVLHIKVFVTGADGKPMPVPRHVLLVSDNPSSAPPREIVTALDGTVDIRLRPGNYTVESDRATLFQGKAYEWRQTLDVRAGRDTVLELTSANADVDAAASPAAGDSTAGATDPAFLLLQWKDSVVTLWTPTSRASGFVIDAKGLVATSQRVVGKETAVEVQVTPDVKVAATVLAADADRDVAVLWIDPKAAASLKPVPLACRELKPPAADEALYAIDNPARAPKGMASGHVNGVEPNVLAADLRLSQGSAGAPVFAAGGHVVGIATGDDDRDAARSPGSRVVRVEAACAVVASADKAMQTAAAPAATHLPLEPSRPFPIDRLKEVVQRRAGSLNPYQMSSAGFDIAFITPVNIYGAQYQAEQLRNRNRGRSGAPPTDIEPTLVRPVLEFENWTDYVSDLPPVLLVRVTPKLVENFWTTVARGAARTQGVALPPIKRIKAGFARLRAFCGDAEVMPIHPFKLEQRVTDTEAIYEGLYVFDPGALGPQCGTVKLTLFPDKQADKPDPRADRGDPVVVDPKIVQQIWQDFAGYREP